METIPILDPTHVDGPRSIYTLGRLRSFTANGVDMTRYVKGPRTLQRETEYRARKAKLGTDDGHNDMVDLCRAAWHSSSRRRIMLDRRRGVRR
jgi:hypothetical protein